jgi:hypothetical protein
VEGVENAAAASAFGGKGAGCAAAGFDDCSTGAGIVVRAGGVSGAPNAGAPRAGGDSAGAGCAGPVLPGSARSAPAFAPCCGFAPRPTLSEVPGRAAGAATGGAALDTLGTDTGVPQERRGGCAMTAGSAGRGACGACGAGAEGDAWGCCIGGGTGVRARTGLTPAGVDDIGGALAAAPAPTGSRIPIDPGDGRVALGRSSSHRTEAPTAMIPPQTEQRARIEMLVILAGSILKTERHSGHETFFGRGCSGCAAPRRDRPVSPRDADRRQRPTRVVSSRIPSFLSQVRSPGQRL